MPAEVIAWFKKKSLSLCKQLRESSVTTSCYTITISQQNNVIAFLAFNLWCFCPAVSLLLFGQLWLLVASQTKLTSEMGFIKMQTTQQLPAMHGQIKRILCLAKKFDSEQECTTQLFKIYMYRYINSDVRIELYIVYSIAVAL